MRTPFEDLRMRVSRLPPRSRAALPMAALLTVGVGTVPGPAAAIERPAKDEESSVVRPGVLRISAGGEHGSGPGDQVVRSLTASITTGLAARTDLTVDGAYVELKSPGAARARGWGDPSVFMRSRFLEQPGRPLDLDYTLGVKLPSGDDRRNLGTEEADFISYLHGARRAGGAEFHLNLGFTIVGLHDQPHRQADSFLWGAAVRAPLGPRASFLVDVFQEHLKNTRRNPFATYEDYATAALAGVRVKIAGVSWDAALFHPFDQPHDIWGVTVGATAELRLAH